jgi:hypothetical protein
MGKIAELIDNKELQNEAFWKGLKVIQSCINLYQLEGAKKYTDRYIELFCKNRKGTLLATESVAHQYETLQIALKEQREKLN